MRSASVLSYSLTKYLAVRGYFILVTARQNNLVETITEDLWIEFLNRLARRSKNLEEVEVLLVDEARGDMVYHFTRG